MKGDLEPVVADGEEVVRVFLQPGKVGVIDCRYSKTKDMSEDFWGYACDV